MSIALGLILAAGKLEVFPYYALVSLMYGVAMGVPVMLMYRWLRPRLHRQSELIQWLVYMAVLIAIVVIATLFVQGILTMVGLMTSATMWSSMLASLQISAAMAIPGTLGAITYARLHKQLGDREADRQRAVAAETEARLASLESRTQPHFLFNALNSAIALIPEDPKRAEKILERLSALLRFSLDAHVSLVPLGDELAVVTDYLEIERVRFGERLVYELVVPDDVRTIEIPAFAVQTLVENSIKYAVSPRKQGGKITVRAHRAEQCLVIDVLDDGPGFNGHVWKAGHGLDSLRSRLDALYGAAAKLVAPAASSAGAAVSIQVPLR